jgi:Co/Zn/Cd efflux system component
VPVPSEAFSLSLTGLGALVVNFFCAFLLSAYRAHRGSLTRAAFLSARNDAIANVAIIAAGFATAYLWHSAWPDLIVGAGIAYMNADAARAVWRALPSRSLRSLDCPTYCLCRWRCRGELGP